MLVFSLPILTMLGFVALGHWYARAQTNYWCGLENGGFPEFDAPDAADQSPKSAAEMSSKLLRPLAK